MLYMPGACNGRISRCCHIEPGFTDLLCWQHLVLGHHQPPEVEDYQSVDTQLPTAEDGVGLL